MVSKKLFKIKIPLYGDEKIVQLGQFFYKKTTIGTQNSELMAELLPNENGFKGKNSHDVKILPFVKTPLLHTRNF